MKSTFDDGICPTPGAAGNHAGQSGGADIANAGPGGQGLHSSPYTDGICSTPGGKETPSSELGTTPLLTDVKDGQSGGAASAFGMLENSTPDSTFKTSK